MTVHANSGLGDRRGRGLKRGYGNTPRGMDEVEIGGVEKRDRVWATFGTEDTTTLSAVMSTVKKSERFTTVEDVTVACL
jgi:hypothetical protein